MSAIVDLPTDPIGLNNISNSNNISMKINELQSIQPQMTSSPQMPLLPPPSVQSPQSTQLPLSPQIPPSQNQQALDQNTINQIINGLQQASLTGATLLPSRDIQMNTDTINTDIQARPNFIPEIPTEKLDYLKMQDLIEEKNKSVKNYQTQQQNTNSLDNFYNTIQMPVLVGLLYFIFQLPIFKNILYNNIPLLFSNDGNYNLYGYIITSLFFALLYHFLHKLLNLI